MRVGPDGHLLLGPEVIHFFDYFFSASGEETDEAIRSRIEAAIRERTKDPATGEALALLERYLAFRKDSKALRANSSLAGDPAARLEAIRTLRRKHFSEDEADALFGEEERIGQVAVERAQVMKDPALTPEEREAKLAELDEKLPEPAREAQQATEGPIRRRAEEQALRAAGATDEEIQRYRVETLGQEAAERLGALDQKRAEWRKRIDAFQAERARLGQTIADEEARKAAEQKLLEESFTPEERLRVRAILSFKNK